MKDVHSFIGYRCFYLAFASLAIVSCGGGGGGGDVGGGGGEMSGPVTTDSGLMMTTTQSGSGVAAQPGNLVSVHYTGWLYEPETEGGRGTQFDSSVDRGTPFQFPLGAGRVIAGWDEGVAGMLIGEKRELIIPPELGYGRNGAGAVIPPDATLLFEVELLAVE